MGRTNIVIDDRLMRRAMKMTGVKTKREAVHLALSRLVDQESVYQTLLGLRGKVRWDGDIDSWRRSRT